jgi:ABC-type proline/glycine betaine transport system substrate-binding protein
MQYTDKDQIGMIASVELDKKTAEQAARDWISKNESVWKTWIPAK